MTATPSPSTRADSQQTKARTAALNYEVALKAERKLVTRCFHKYSSETRADLAASFRLTQNQRRSIGHYFYVHPAFPNTAFETQGDAARAALLLANPKPSGAET